MLFQVLRFFRKAAPFGAVLLLGGCSRISLLDPGGPIEAGEKSVILWASGLMLIVVLPVFAMTFAFARRYRASNKAATYAPDWATSHRIEFVVWLVPALIIGALAYITWTSTHELSPERPLASAAQPVRVDAVSLDWKWLFIYPDLHIATVNRLVFPKGVPVDFRLTSDRVTTSFFIPRLGSQVYAMPGMATELHLLADKAGDYTGRNFQFSGRGYASMKFKATATSQQAFKAWVAQVRQSGRVLDEAAVAQLRKPSTDTPVELFGSARPHLFKDIIHLVRTADAAPHAAHDGKGA